MRNLATALTCRYAIARDRLRARTGGQDPDAGASALEYVIIAVGAIIVAGLVVAAVTAFVNGKISEIG
jgi:hypothetical protein